MRKFNFIVIAGAIAVSGLSACGGVKVDDKGGVTVDTKAAQMKRFQKDLQLAGYFRPFITNIRVATDKKVMEATATINGCDVELQFERELGSALSPSSFTLDEGTYKKREVKLKGAPTTPNPHSPIVMRYVAGNPRTFKCGSNLPWNPFR